MVMTDTNTGQREGPAPVPSRPEGTPTGQAGPGTAAEWTPLSGPALLDRLRFTGRRRPQADPERAERLRHGLELGLRAELGPVPSIGQPPLVITKGRLNQVLAEGLGPDDGAFGERPFTLSLACGALIDVLFRQLVTVGSVGEPMVDGLAALALDERQAPLATWVERLPVSERLRLSEEVNRQAFDLSARWPTLQPGWLPRTQESMRVGLVDGFVELSARVDLALGRPGLEVASVAIVEVKSGRRRPEHRHDAHFYALVETLRSPAPPFAVATYYSRTGELEVEAVTDELLTDAAQRTLAGGLALLRSSSPVDSTVSSRTPAPAWGQPRHPEPTATAGPDRHSALDQRAA
jgi:hypothetical protein